MTRFPTRPRPGAHSSSLRWIRGFGLPVIVGVAVLAAGTILPHKDHLMAADLEGRVQAPELEVGLDWLNTAGPLRLKDLKGKIVILDFWTLC